MFVGRQTELAKFNERYEGSKAELIFLYGRRRVGKTEFLRKFAEDKSQLFFYSAVESGDFEQRERFKTKMLHSGYMGKPETLHSWESIFKSMAFLNKHGKSLVIIDEFQYLFSGNKSIPSILQNVWDEHLSKTNIMLILCGSAMSFIENDILGSKNPLYGRGTAIFKLKELDFYEAGLFFPEYSAEDKMRAYMILGGIPFYLKQFDCEKSIEDNIKANILSPETILYNEIDFLMKQQLRETAIYNTIIAAIALGNTQLNDIHQKTQIDKAKITTYISNLIDLHLVEREMSVSAKEKESANIQRGLYRLSDSFFRFWYRYVYPNKSEIECGLYDLLYEEVIAPDLNEFLGSGFERIAMEYLYRQNLAGNLPIRFNKCGRFWNKGCEIDILAIGKSGVIFGECKWRNQAQGMEVYDALAAKSQGLFDSDKKYYYIFSKNGFTDSLSAFAANNRNVFLVDLNQMRK